MGKTIKLKKGYNINIQGAAQKTIATNFSPTTFAVRPIDFHGFAPIPKMLVEEGQEVRAGDPLFFDKRKEHIKLVSPVSGEIAEIRRGPKRRIDEVIILADSGNQYREIPSIDITSCTREALVDHMCENGVWPFLTQRPYGIMAEADVTPKAIFISGFDSAPLAPDSNFAVTGQGNYLQKGVDVLRKLTPGKVHFSVNGAGQMANEFSDLTGAEIHKFEGPHPAGVVGIQIHHIDPINKNDVVWTVRLQDLIAIGRIYKDWQFNTERLVAVAGPPVKEPKYFKTFLGASLEKMLDGNLKSDHVRLISGNALTGSTVDAKSHLRYQDTQVTVLTEGDEYEFMGWLLPSYKRPTLSGTFLGGLFGNKSAMDVNTNTHGEHRAFVVTGEYEKVLPMDLHPQALIKNIMFQDLDYMEGLGIYEVIEEDIALCEFACTSKSNLQQILRQGINLMLEQG